MIKDALDEKSASIGKDTNVSYTIDTTARGTDVATISLKLAKPLTEAQLVPRSKSILKDLADSLGATNIGIVDAILAELGIKTKRVGRKRVIGDVSVNTGVVEPEDPGSSDYIKSVSGQTTDVRKLQGILELVAKKYLIKAMKEPNAPLKYRTGRFANSMRITSLAGSDLDALADSVGTTKNRVNRKKPRVSVLYTYMTYPYATFDPRVSSRPEMYMKPFYGARNPQILIGEAIAKAARDLLYKGYDVNVSQGV